MTAIEDGIWHATHCIANADKRWDERRTRGEDDAEFRDSCMWEMGTGGISWPGGPTYSWSSGLKLWVDTVPNSKPTIEGAKLLKLARVVLGIPVREGQAMLV